MRNTIGLPFIELDEIDSTNNYAFDKLQANLATHGTTIFAHTQTAGKGQRGKIWNSEPGANILLSVILDTSFLSTVQQFPLSIAMALGVHDFYSKYAGDECKIKWPNDIYWRDRKAGGILIENLITSRLTEIGSWQWAVAGIGININQTFFPKQLTNPVSLKQITGKDFNVVTLARELCNSLEYRFQQLIKRKTKEQLQQYNQNLYKRYESVRLKKENAAFNCTIEGVNKNGELLVKGTGKENFTFGEVKWI
jgi:BirA family biotin operon repressor/biotin-[acetyl-CoA-carboxylase] ligase